MIIPTQMNNYINESWTQLESENQIGLVKRLIPHVRQYKVYCIYDYTSKSYGIGLSFPRNIRLNLSPFSNLNHLKIQIFEDSSFRDNLILSALLSESDKKDIFSYLCVNVIQALEAAKNIIAATHTFGNTLLRWKKLFESSHTDLLSKEEQQGLYGELLFLKRLIEHNPLSLYNAVQAYIGCSRAVRDFQDESWAVEVKTTSTNNPQLLTINGERQLDDSLIGSLFLCHTSVEIMKNSGTTLPDIVNSIKDLLKSDCAALLLFNAKLFETGYKEESVHLYKEFGYKIRFTKYYHVHDNFPRILEKDLRQGVGNVRYEITMPQSEMYSVAESIVLDKCMLSHD